ncbi:MAG TPA: substrate-binding domain-containing protein [Tepidisphaeraceae bacterium]|nr:substrate-binding domain-containing protein [Tepidisphaeraceae bacterium]
MENRRPATTRKNHTSGKPSQPPALGTPAAAADRQLVALRVPAWSDWDRQVIRGVQRFAHGRPRWRLYVESGAASALRIATADLRLDGLITGALRDPAPVWQRLLKRMRGRMVAITSAVPLRFASIARVQVDDDKIAATIGRHLISSGFRNLAYYGSRRPGLEDLRLNAITTFARSRGYPCHLLPAQAGQGAVTMPQRLRWIRQLPKPIGIVTWNMSEARDLLAALDRAGVAVPEDVAVVSWDDDPMLAETLEPTISAAVLPAERLGFEAAQLLDRLMNGEAAPAAPTRIEPTGVMQVRQSSDVSTLADRDAHLAMQYIREHGTEPIKVSHVAAALRLSRRSLEIAFKNVAGKTLHEAITEVRMERARQLLAETDWPLSRVAEQSGVGTEETLRRLFLATEQLTPGAYRSRFSGV